MKVVLASYGTRGDIEPCLVVGRELMRRGHDVRVAVPPNLVPFAEAIGLEAVVYGPDSETEAKDFGLSVFQDFPQRVWRMKDLVRAWREYWSFVTRCWAELTDTLISVADGADLLFTGLVFEDGAANVAEHYGIPLATLHYIPARANGRLLAFLPKPLARLAMRMFWWFVLPVFGRLEQAQRRQLGLPKAKGPAPQRITERGALEIQAYDEVVYPGLASEWAQWASQRPFVGTLTLELPTAADDEAMSWISTGTPPICFAFGSMSTESPDQTIVMISEACSQLGERALVCSGVSDFSCAPRFEHVKVVAAVDYSQVFPACRAVVHHGGAGTLAAVLRAGVPQIILWTAPDRLMSGRVLEHLKVGTTRRFCNTTAALLAEDLRRILTPKYIDRARMIATQMSTPAQSATATADLLEAITRNNTQ